MLSSLIETAFNRYKDHSPSIAANRALRDFLSTIKNDNEADNLSKQFKENEVVIIRWIENLRTSIKMSAAQTRKLLHRLKNKQWKK